MKCLQNSLTSSSQTNHVLLICAGVLYKRFLSRSASGRQSPKMMLYTHPSCQGRKEGTSKKLVVYTYCIVKQML